MNARPFIIVKIKAEHLAVQQDLDFNSFFDDSWQIFVEEVRGGVVILVPHDVVYNGTHCFYLVVLEGSVDCRPVEVLLVCLRPLLHLVFVKYGVVLVKVIVEIGTK